MKNKIFATTILTLVFAVMSSMSFAQRGQRGQGQGYGQGQGLYNQQNFNGQWNSAECRIPGLTKEQEAKITALRIEQRKAAKVHRADVAILRAEYQKLLLADNIDMKAVNKTIDKIAGMRATQMKQRLAHRQEVRSLLTDEQKAVYDNMPRRNGRGFGNGDGNGRRHGNGDGFGRRGSLRGDCIYNNNRRNW